MQELFPGEMVHVKQRWAGTIAMTADGLPWMRSVARVMPATACLLAA